ncbi:MAG: redoxin domain-containing protein [Planctomycetes bacterium]|nr:redoxin domain-containing protein [Planctomycetota bacterium]
MPLSRRCAPAVFAILLAGCAGGPTASDLDHANGRPARRGTLTAGRQEGLWEFWHENGQREARGSYRDDLRIGHWQHWYPDGKPRMAGEYDGKRQVGDWQFWHPNGERHCAGTYVDGREHGEWSFWNDAGQLQQRGCFAAGKRTLWWMTWHDNGQPKSYGCHVADMPVGRWQLWDEAGQLREVDYPLPAGLQLVRETWDDGSTRREGIVQQDRRFGLWLTRHRGGALRLLGELVNDQPVGTWTACAADGSPWARGPVVDGQPNGVWTITDAGGRRSNEATNTPQPPWEGTWSEASLLSQAAPFDVVQRWLRELTSPLLPVMPAPVEEPPSTPLPEPPPRQEAPTEAGAFTVRELRELEFYRRYYKNGWLPPDSGGGTEYGATTAGRLGGGDDALARRLLGKPLPVTTFRDAAGKPFELASLRGKKVLFVVLRGFNTQVCVYCFAQTAELAPFVPDLRAADCELVVLFPGSKSRLDAFAALCKEEFGGELPYTMLYDPDLQLTTALGLTGNLARPSSLVLDRDGTVRSAYVAENERNIADRPPASELLRAVRKL